VSQFDDIDVMRTLPHAPGPEKSILSSMLQDPQEFIGRAIEQKLTVGHFYLPAHSSLFGYLLGLYEAGTEIELVSLVQKLQKEGALDKMGGPSAITDLYTYAPTGGHFNRHLAIVKDNFTLREVITSASEATQAAYDLPDEVDELLDGVEARILAIRESRLSIASDSVKPSISKALETLQDRTEGRERKDGLKTGFEELDRMTDGLKPGEVFVVAARPSMGKTSFMMNLVENVAIDQEKPTLVFSCEMSKDQLVERTMYSRARINARGLNMPNKGEMMKLTRACTELAGAPLFIDDTPGITINYLRAKARRKMRETGLALIAIDYLQLMKSTSKQAQGSREREVAEISAGIKGLAKELGIPIVLLAQVNREADKRTGKAAGIPRMSDLRESGSIEQDADYIGLLHRPEVYAEEAERESLAGLASLILAKNRSGETGTIPLTFIGSLMRFENGQARREEPEQKPQGRLAGLFED
jgi:replicative DNA helicase